MIIRTQKLSGSLTVVDVATSKMAWKPVKLQKKFQQDALEKVNRVKDHSPIVVRKLVAY